MIRKFATMATLAAASTLAQPQPTEPVTSPHTLSTHVQQLRHEDFERSVLQGRGTVLVYLSGSTWCGPCIAMKPVINDLAEHTGGRYVVKNVDFNTSEDDRRWFYKNIGDVYHVESVPTLLLFRDGQLINRYDGYGGEDKSVVRSWLNKALAVNPTAKPATAKPGG